MTENSGKLNWRSDVDKGDYIILFGGVISTTVVMVLAHLALNWSLVIISWMVWFIFPVGSIVLGLGSALGFYITARARHKKMSVLAAIVMILILIPAYFGHYYLVYSSTQVETESGEIRPAPKEISFWQFYRYDLTNRVYIDSHSFSREENKKPAGRMGYLYGSLEIIGFLIGGIAMLYFLSLERYCDSCQRFFSDAFVGKTNQEDVAITTKEHLESGHEQLFKNDLIQWVNSVKTKEYLSSKRIFTLSFSYCKICYRDSLAFIKYQNLGNNKQHDLARGAMSESLTRILLGATA